MKGENGKLWVCGPTILLENAWIFNKKTLLVNISENAFPLSKKIFSCHDMKNLKNLMFLNNFCGCRLFCVHLNFFFEYILCFLPIPSNKLQSLNFRTRIFSDNGINLVNFVTSLTVFYLLHAVQYYIEIRIN